MSGKEMKEKIIFNDEEETEANKTTKNFFLDYIDLIENRNEGTYSSENTTIVKAVKLHVANT
jgi:hypothetical protein